jgi:hypothetical protein
LRGKEGEGGSRVRERLRGKEKEGEGEREVKGGSRVRERLRGKENKWGEKSCYPTVHLSIPQVENEGLIRGGPIKVFPSPILPVSLRFKTAAPLQWMRMEPR